MGLFGDPSADWLAETLKRLDLLLSAACDREERRAKLLTEGAGRGWEGVRGMLRPAVADLLQPSASSEPPLLSTRGPLADLAQTFSLAAVELDALVLLLAAHVEPRYRTLCAVLADSADQAWVTERVMLAVLGDSPARRQALQESLGPGGRLRETGLVTCSDGQPPLAATYDLAVEVRHAALSLARPEFLERCVVRWVDAEARPAPHTLVVVHGDGSHAEVLTEALAHASHCIVTAPEDEARALQLGHAVWRLGAAYSAAGVLDLTSLEHNAAQRTVEQLAHKVQRFGGALGFLAQRGFPLALPHVETVALGFTERKELWLSVARANARKLDEDTAARFAAAYRLDRARVLDVFASTASDDPEVLAAQAIRLCSTRIPHGTAVTARRTFEDIVLGDTTRTAIERLIYFVKNRDRVAELRGLGHRFQLNRGPIALFSGRSGTGKTLAAEVISKELGRPLHVVDLARLVSKYVGETEQNIDDVLRAGQSAGAVLFFDEADSLFSQRTEVSNSNDRFANLEVGYLLQRIETHDGLVILATNLRQSIDEAFLRRFHARIEFQLPGPRERRIIWELMLPSGVERAEDLAFDELGREHDLSGGDIRNAALKAIFLAEQEGSPVTQRHLERGVALELLELGRLSRQHEPEKRDAGVKMRTFGRILQRSIEARLRDVFLKEIHLIHGAPTKENLAGKQPAVSLALFRMAQPRSGGLRLGFVVSAWSERAEEEHELLGVLHDLVRDGTLSGALGTKATLKMAESYDFDLLHRFWSSHGHPVRASLLVDAEVHE